MCVCIYARVNLAVAVDKIGVSERRTAASEKKSEGQGELLGWGMSQDYEPLTMESLRTEALKEERLANKDLQDLRSLIVIAKGSEFFLHKNVSAIVYTDTRVKRLF